MTRSRALTPYGSVVVGTELSATSDRVRSRIPHLSLAAGATITVVHATEHEVGVELEASCAAEAEQLASRLRGGRVEHVVRRGPPQQVITEVARERGADLIVVGRGNGRALRDLLVGSTAEQIVRSTTIPVLTVRTPAETSYARPAVGVELGHRVDVIRPLLRLLGSSLPTTLLIHADQTPFKQLAATLSDSGEGDRRMLEAKVRRVVDAAIAGAGFQPSQVPLVVQAERGSPRSVLIDVVRRSDVDLLVLGTRGYRGLAYAFLGSVAGEVQRYVPCDVLVVPPDPLEE